MAAPNFGTYVLGPRINLKRSLVTEDTMEPASSIVKREDKDDRCSGPNKGDTCEMPVDSSSTKLPLILGIVIPVLVALCVLFYLHRRNMRRQRQEDAKDPNMHLDFGMDTGSGKKRKSLMFGAGEKQLHKPGQLSMDMNLSSPYLLPPGAHQSRDSLHSLARTLPSETDPYRTVAHYTNSDAGSMRSFSRDPSMYNKRMSGKSVATTVRAVPVRTNSIPVSPVSPPQPNPFSTPLASKPPQELPLPPAPVGRPANEQAPVKDVSSFGPPYPAGPQADELFLGNNVQAPPTALSKDVQGRAISRPESALSDKAYAKPNERMSDQDQTGLGLNFDFPQPGSPVNARQENSSYGQPQIQTSTYYEDYEQEERGRSAERESRVDPDQGLAIPSTNNKRLSVGFRPLPPDEVTETDDPETRANRIRSFYREYFDDTKDAALPSEPMPKIPQQYYEDYDAGYLGEATYYDANSNAFVTPYAEPVTRRAMTPPPAGRSMGGPRGPGPLGPPRAPFTGGMRSMSPGPNRPRAGSLGPRGPPSVYSSRAPSSVGGPRPGSSASARGRAPPKKMGPPPAALHTLPAPSKLKDDNFAIINAMDFAPPDNFKDQAAGRSQSPFGERRPYHNPSVPVASPLVSAFDEMAALPSPHLLRKSSTFTGLDFAPPKKFKDADTMSDAGSIRSNRSGISAANLGAIRSGAGRVSRLPGDTVFTTAAMADELKPSWGVRP